MTIINNNTVVIYNSDELKKVLEEENNYTTIYFGNDITLTTGISISSSKTSVIIDGAYNGVIHTFTDKKSSSTSDTIMIKSPLIKNVIVQNMNVTGYNYYGVICVTETNLYKDTVVEYNNVTYKGPQISFHPYGLTRFINCEITIEDNYNAGNEVAECNKIEIGGITNITHKSTGNSSFWFRNSNPSFTILASSTVNFTSEKRELIYGVTNLTFNILKNANFHVTTYNGLSYGNYGTGNTTIGENALFTLKQTNRNGGYSTWYSYGTINLAENSSLNIINNYPNISSNNYNIYFSGDNAGLILNNPKKVALYNSSANIIYSSSTIPFEFNFNRLNLFNDAIDLQNEITNDTLPTYAWYKDNISNIKGTFSNSKTTITSHNYSEEELRNVPNLDNFIFVNKKIFSIGDFQIHMNALTDKDTQIKGITDPLSSILIKYNDVSTVVIADDKGAFTYTYTTELPIGTNITLIAKKINEPIYHTKSIQIVYSGELILDSASKVVNFTFEPISTNPILCPRKNNLIITVIDSRVASSNWKLYASIDSDLTSDTGVTLKDALVFVGEDSIITPLSKTPILVYEGESNDGNVKTTNIIWNQDKGILLRINDTLINGMKYNSTINWYLEE